MHNYLAGWSAVYNGCGYDGEIPYGVQWPSSVHSPLWLSSCQWTLRSSIWQARTGAGTGTGTGVKTWL